MWRSEDIFFGLAGGIDPFTRVPVADEFEHANKARESGGQLIFMIAPPLMHGAAFVATTMQLFQGNVNVIVPKRDATEVWRQIAGDRVNSILIVGDAMGRPLIEALEALDAAGEQLDLSCLLSVSSSAAVFSPTVKDAFLERFPNLVITDSIGATESGFNGLVTVAKGDRNNSAGSPTVSPGKDTVVLDDDLNLVTQAAVGKSGRSGNIPLGYYKDPVKTAETWVTAADGKRYAMPGDFARLEADGTITLLGRGSVCINTGGEKVYPEEVEGALKAHPSVFDVVVVGVPDERWGQRVAAVVQARDGHTPTLAELDEHVRTTSRVQGARLHLVDEIVRSPSGKPDYPWAKQVAESGTNKV
jgi:acyl-CoA synthetase (AMP-forming)/AMP-acid ligase II